MKKRGPKNSKKFATAIAAATALDHLRAKSEDMMLKSKTKELKYPSHLTLTGIMKNIITERSGYSAANARNSDKFKKVGFDWPTNKPPKMAKIRPVV